MLNPFASAAFSTLYLQNQNERIGSAEGLTDDDYRN